MEFDFGTNTTVDSIEKVPEQFRALYGQAEGGFAIQETFLPITAALDGLNKSLRAARKDAEAAKKGRVDLSPLAQALEIEGEATVDAVKAAVDGLKATMAKGEQGRVNWDKMKKDLEAGFQGQVAAKDQEVKTMQASLERFLVDREAVAAVAAAKGVPDLLLPHIKGAVKVVRDGEEYVVRVVDAAGDPRGDGKGGFMTVADLVKEMKASPTFGRAFDSEVPQGAGVRPGSMSRNPPPKAGSGELTSIQKIAAGLARRQGR